MRTKPRAGLPLLAHLTPELSTKPEQVHGEATSRSYRIAYQGGQWVMGIPFAPGGLTTVDPSGNVRTARSERYRVARVGPAGDTDPGAPGRRATAPAHAGGPGCVDGRHAIHFEMAPQVRGELVALLPEHKPALARLLTDDEGRLWVGHTADPEELPLYDVFSPHAEYLGSLRMPHGLVPSFPPIIRHGHLYALVRGDFDVPYVVRAPVPAPAPGGP